jgi:hypothetical protein
MSFWSEPYIRGFGRRWINPLTWNLSWILSVEAVTKIYGKPHLYTDDAGKNFLVDQLGLDFASVDLSLNDLKGKNPRFFSLGRTYTLGVQKEPFIHFDYDAYLFDIIPQEVFENGVLLERQFYRSIEKHPKAPCRPELFSDFDVPSWWNNYKVKNEHSFATLGIVGGSNLEYFNRFSQTIFDIISLNQEKFDNFFFSKPTLQYVPQDTLDQYVSVMLAKEMSFSPRFLVSMNQIAKVEYAHAGEEKAVSSELFGRIISRIVKDHPKATSKIEKLAGIGKIEIPTVSVIVIPNSLGSVYDSTLRVIIPRKIAPSETIVSDFRLHEAEKKLLSKIDGIRFASSGPTYLESIRNAFKKTSGKLLIIVDGHIKVPKLYIERAIAASIEFPNAFFCTASKDFEDNKIAISYGGLEDDYGIRPNLSQNKDIVLDMPLISALYGGVVILPIKAAHLLLDMKDSINSMSDISRYLISKGFECRCIKSIEVSNNFKAKTSFSSES